MYRLVKITSGFQVDMRALEMRSHVAVRITVMDVTGGIYCAENPRSVTLMNF